jgi:hypothetical protein
MATHPLVAAQRAGSDEHEGTLLVRLASAAESALQRAREACATAGGDDAAVAKLLRDAQLAVDSGALQGLNFGAEARPVVRWKEDATRELVALAVARWGVQQRAVRPLDYTPLR